jgi:hypothetical protein
VNLLFHYTMCVPAKKQHAKIHGAHSEDKMEEPVTIWYVVFQSYYVPELQIFEKSFYLTATTYFKLLLIWRFVELE